MDHESNIFLRLWKAKASLFGRWFEYNPFRNVYIICKINLGLSTTVSSEKSHLVSSDALHTDFRFMRW